MVKRQPDVRDAGRARHARDVEEGVEETRRFSIAARAAGETARPGREGGSRDSGGRCRRRRLGGLRHGAITGTMTSRGFPLAEPLTVQELTSRVDESAMAIQGDSATVVTCVAALTLSA